MRLDLVDCRDELRLVKQAAEVVGVKVRDADGPSAVVPVHALECAPRLDEVANGRQRPVDEEEIDIFEAKVAQCPVKGGESIAVRVVVVV